ncbi:unnamed protein product [Ectocarpus sp. 6 AP-2014]
MVVAVARTLAAGVALALATRARGFMAPAAVTTMSGARAARPCSSRWPCSRTHSSQQQQQQQQQQGVAFAPTSQFLGCASRGRRRIAAQGCASSAAGCTAAAGAVSTSPTMGLRVLAPGGGRRLAFAAMANAAAFAAVGGGVLAGGLHAVSGPDHLAALLPRIMGQKWHKSMRIGATWGLGHGFSATVIGLAAFFFKDRLGLGHNERLVAMMGSWTEGLVGVSLIAIGLLGLKESLLDYEETPAYEAKSAGSAVVEGGGAPGGGGMTKSGGGERAIFFNGVLHGFSWDGAPSLAPALALSSWGSVLWFLLAYCSGTMVAMSATTTLIGEGSVRVGKALDQPDIPRKLSVVSSFVAITIGAVWLAKAVFF